MFLHFSIVRSQSENLNTKCSEFCHWETNCPWVMNSFSHSRRLSSLNIDWQIFSDHFSAEFFFCSDFFACHGAKAKPPSVRRKHEKTQIIMNLYITNLFMTSESPKIRIPIVQIFCYDYFCLIKSSVNHSGITKPFLNPNIIFTSNCLLQNH